MDPMETSGWLQTLKKKELFIQSAIDDRHVQNIQTHLLVRSVNAKLLEKPNRSVQLIETTPSPATIPTVPFIEWKYTKTPTLPETNEVIVGFKDSPHMCVKSYATFLLKWFSTL